MTSRPSRRALLGAALALPALWLVPGAGRAMTAADADRLVQQVAGEINSVINSGKPEGAMLADFEQIFARWADVGTVARSVLGPDARSASPAQMRAFADAFRGYVARKYGRRFREAIGGKIIVRDVQQERTFYAVRATADLRGQAPFAVTFLVSDRGGRPMFFDMLVEGISLVKSERTEIGAMLDRRRGDLDALTADLRRL